MSPLRRFIALALITGLVTLVADPAGAALSRRERKLARLVNNSRTNNGSDALSLNEKLSRFAHNHSRQMAIAGVAFHSTSGQLTYYLNQTASCGNTIAEVVLRSARNATVSDVHHAFMHSSAHRAIILDPKWERMGIGIYKRYKRMYATELFCN